MKVRPVLVLSLIVAAWVILGTHPLTGADRLLLDIDIVAAKDHIRLSWTPDTLYCTYEVHRFTTPNFIPGPATLQASVAAGMSSTMRWVQSTGSPTSDQIRELLFRPSAPE